MRGCEIFKKKLLLATKSSQENGTKKFIGKHKVNGNASKKPKKSKKDNMILENHEEILPREDVKRWVLEKHDP